MNITDWLATASKKIKSDTPQLDAEILLAHQLGKNRAYLHAFAENSISAKHLKELNFALLQLEKNYPLAYIIGTKSFWDMDLKVNEHTLIPRADTETLIELLIDTYPTNTPLKLLDLGTGSGAIAIAITRVFPNACVIATDINPDTLGVAQENAAQWAKSKITFLKSNWFEDLPNNQFDCIVSNPPYIDKTDPHLHSLTFEPTQALVSDESGLFDIKKIIEGATKYLNPKGGLFIEHGYNQGPDICELFNQNPLFKNAHTVKDLSANPRVSYSFLK